MMPVELSDALESVVLGVALGDALGNRLEFMHAPGDDDFQKQLSLPLIVSDDTQMMLFSLEALRQKRSFADAYQRWYITQDEGFSGDGLLRFAEMFDVQSPGATCVAACKALQRGEAVANNSKGNGTVMRCAHLAYEVKTAGGSLAQSITLAREDAETTHKHPYAAMSSALLTAIHWGLIDGLHIGDALSLAIDSVDVPPDIVAICQLALNRERYRRMRGEKEGWVAEEALALAIGAVAHNSTFLDAIRSAVTISGDSDTVGAIAGGLAAGSGLVPPTQLARRLNVWNPIQYALSL